MGSILIETKAALGLAADQTAFDAELVMFINAVLSRLTQLGVGPQDTGFRIADATATWENFLGPSPKLDMVQGYMYKSVKLMFDPPEIGFVLTMMKELIEKDEYLINLEVEPMPVFPPATREPDVFGEPIYTVLPDGTVLDGGEN